MRSRGYMTFEEIGQAEGISPQRAQYIFRCAIEKLRRTQRKREFVRLVFLYRTRKGSRPERLTAG
jgi:DNA-directed RNA polymerase sigma subunit (sigma70/sigma32)